jgi:hypothetical protein
VESPLEPLDGADGCCCGAWGEEEAGWVGAAAGGLAGAGGLGSADVAASSKAANGCESASWLDKDACIRDCEVSETAAGKSGAILDILDTREPLEATWPLVACNPRASGP